MIWFKNNSSQLVQISLCIFSVVFLFSLVLTPAHALSTSVVPDLTVSPYLLNITGDPGTSQDEKFQLRNNTNADLYVAVSFENFSAANDKSGEPSYFKSTGSTDYTYYPQTWFVAPKTLKISANKELDILVHVNIPDGASPGGHYGGAIFYPSHTDITPNENINVAGKIAVPVLIRVSGNILDRMGLSHFSLTPNFISLFSFFNGNMLCLAMPDCSADANFEFHNTGNIHEVPVGDLQVFDMFGNKVFASRFNDKEQTAILPYTSRIYDSYIPMSKINGFKEGLYTAKISLIYSDQHLPLKSTLTFWMFDWTPLAVLIVVGGGGYIIYLKKFSKRAKFRSKIG